MRIIRCTTVGVAEAFYKIVPENTALDAKFCRRLPPQTTFGQVISLPNAKITDAWLKKHARILNEFFHEGVKTGVTTYHTLFARK